MLSLLYIYADEERSYIMYILDIIALLILLILPPGVAVFAHQYLNESKISIKRKTLLFIIYFLIIFLVESAVCWRRGITGFNPSNMTVTFKLKYMCLGCLLGDIIPTVVFLGLRRNYCIKSTILKGVFYIGTFLIVYLSLVFIQYYFESGNAEGYEEYNVELLKCEVNGERVSGKIELCNKNDIVCFDLDNAQVVENVYIQIVSYEQKDIAENAMFEGEVWASYEGLAYDYSCVGKFYLNPYGEMNDVLLPLDIDEKLIALKIVVKSDLVHPVLLEKCTFNRRTSLSRGKCIMLGMVLTLIFFIYKEGIWKIGYNTDNRLHRVMMSFILLFNIGMVIWIGGNAYNKYGVDDYEYPLSTVKGQNEYVQLFDAWQNRRLDIQWDGLDNTISQLNNMSNPYDKSERGLANNIGNAIWDHAFYNGKIYVYFGMTPLIVVYYPYFLITGKLPSDIHASMLLALFAVVACWILICEFAEVFSNKIGIVELGLFHLVTPGLFLIYLLESCADFYHIAALSSITCILYFIVFLILLHRCKLEVWKDIFWMCAGMAYALAVMSKPTVVIAVSILVLPLLWHEFADIIYSDRGKIKGFLCFTGPLLIAGIVQMTYNYLRFESIFEFGAMYQLTVNDVRKSIGSISINSVKDCIYSYILQPTKTYPFFPFFSTSVNEMYTYIVGKYTFKESNGVMALCNFPVYWSLLFVSETVKEKVLSWWQVGGCIAAGTVAMLVDYLLIGCAQRYMIDFIIPIVFLSLTTICVGYNRLREKNKMYWHMLLSAVMVYTIFMSYMLIFSNGRRYIYKFNADEYIRVARMFGNQIY